MDSKAIGYTAAGISLVGLLIVMAALIKLCIIGYYPDEGLPWITAMIVGAAMMFGGAKVASIMRSRQ